MAKCASFVDTFGKVERDGGRTEAIMEVINMIFFLISNSSHQTPYLIREPRIPQDVVPFRKFFSKIIEFVIVLWVFLTKI